LLTHLPHRAVNACSPATHATEASAIGARNGYSPAYSAPIPVESQEESVKEEPDAVDAWKGVKSLLRTFVGDLNRHLADNFGDEAAGFELSLPTVVEPSADVAATVQEPTKQASEAVQKVQAPVHSSVFCDNCLSTIVGTRFKCTDCPNWDCCQVCLSDFASFHDSTHVLGEITKPGAPLVKQQVERVVEATPVAKEVAPVEHPATCNSCDQTIKGIRHKCLNCPDYDVCNSCFALVGTIHPHHNFVPISDPSSVKLKVQPGERVVHRNIICDGCETTPIIGVRYACTHESCKGQFDLCASCEASPIPVHPRSHHLLKLREPVVRSTVTAAVQAARARMGDRRSIASILQSFGVVPPTSSSETAAAGVASNAQLIDGPGNDHTLVIDLDIDAHAAGLPKTIHVPISVPAGGVETVVAPSVVATPQPESANSDVVVTETDSLVAQDSKEEETIPSPEVASPRYSAEFVCDVTLMDRSSVAPGALFTKIWKVKNNGATSWPAGTHLVHVGGYSTSTEDIATKDVPLAEAGATVEIQCDLKAPEDEGRVMFLFRLSDAENNVFGERIWVDITVVQFDEEALRSSGSLSSSIVIPSPNVAPPSTVATRVSMDAVSVDHEESSDSESEEEDDLEEEESSIEDSEESSSESEDEDDEFVILTGSEQASEASDAEWDV
ncbi:hypothetical protein P7C70_g380, partial [Phenoliferia sp. Uapishka_3]